MKHYTESMTKLVLNETSGELETQLFIRDIEVKNSGKQGWTKMYKNGYDMVIFYPKSQDNLKKNLIPFKIHYLMH